MARINEYFKAPVTKEIQDNIKKLDKQGFSRREIASLLNVGVATVQKYAGANYTFTPEQIAIARKVYLDQQKAKELAGTR